MQQRGTEKVTTIKINNIFIKLFEDEKRRFSWKLNGKFNVWRANVNNGYLECFQCRLLWNKALIRLGPHIVLTVKMYSP